MLRRACCYAKMETPITITRQRSLLLSVTIMTSAPLDHEALPYLSSLSGKILSRDMLWNVSMRRAPFLWLVV